MSQDSFEHCVEILKQSDDYRVIKRFEPVSASCDDATEDHKRVGFYLDVEITGLNAGTDKIIELAMVTFEFLPDGRIFKIRDRFDQFQDPGFPIPEGSSGDSLCIYAYIIYIVILISTLSISRKLNFNIRTLMENTARSNKGT